jgi:saccharopine dehydrogenase-like NADP-dependent oxidoreductase
MAMLVLRRHPSVSLLLFTSFFLLFLLLHHCNHEPDDNNKKTFFVSVNGFGLSSSSSTTSIRIRKRIRSIRRRRDTTLLTSLTSLTNDNNNNDVGITALSARSTGNDDDNNDNTGATTTATAAAAATTVLVVGGSGRVGGSTVRWLKELSGRTENKLNLKIKVGCRTKKSFDQAKKRGVIPSDINDNDFVQLDWAEWNDEQIENAIVSSKGNNNMNDSIGLVVHTAGPFQGRTDPTLLRCCIKNKIQYVDVCDEYELALKSKELFDKDAKELGITAVVSSGIWPGVSALMAANAVEKLEEQQEEDDNGSANLNKADTIDFSFFTAGTGNAGPTIVSATFLLLATPVLAYRNSKKIELEPWTEKRYINFGKSIDDKPVWLLDNPDVPTTALSLGGIPNVSSRFGTDPLPWNYLFGAMKIIPRSILYNRDIMQNFALFSEPIIRFVDKIVGSTNAMRVDVSNKDKTKTITSLIVHNDLEMCVGLATAAFAIEVLKKNNGNIDDDVNEQQTIPSGVWYPAELPKQARLNILEVVKEGTITYEV